MGSRQDDHNRGEKNGAKAGIFDQLAERTNPFSSPEYKQGYFHGVRQQNPTRGSSGPGRSPDSFQSASGGGGGGGADLPFPLLMIFIVPVVVGYFIWWLIQNPKALAPVLAVFIFSYILFRLTIYASSGGHEQLAASVHDLKLFSIFCGVSWLIGGSKGRPGLGFALGFLGPIGWVIIAILQRREVAGGKRA